MLTARVAVDNTAYSFDTLFDYLIPDDAANQTLRGCRVLVGFGKGNSKRQGFVFDVFDEKERRSGLKKIIRVLDEKPLLDDEAIEIAKWLSGRTFCTYFEAAKALVPSGYYLRSDNDYCSNVDKNKLELLELGITEQQIVRYLIEKNRYVRGDKILSDLGLAPDMIKVVDNLCRRGYIISNENLSRVVNDATAKIAFIADEYLTDGTLPYKPTPKQESVLSLLRTVGSASTKEIAYYTGVSPSVVERLHREGIVEFKNVTVSRSPNYMRDIQPDAGEIVLTSEQNDAFVRIGKKLGSGEPSAALLFGVTGSGKTMVYLRLVDECVKKGWGVIMMVPEISLTPQTLKKFYSRYAGKVAVLHSGLSLGERLDEWKRVKSGEATIVVGTRSAVFAPVKNLALIIMDEEQESAYKSEMSPRYHARDVAKFRCAYNKALLLLGSATPSVDTYAAALAGRYELIQMQNRYSDSELPAVSTVDISDRDVLQPTRTISRPLENALRQNLKAGRQAILLINRRGYNTFVSCTSCKKVISCPNCSLSLTYHSANDRMMCHFCGHSEPVRTTCPECGSSTIRFSGFGTQKVEQEVRALFPQANVLRMDADTTLRKNSHEKLLGLFANGDYDILIGTQMVAKGLDFPNVTLVGVVSVDQMLYNDDYKSSERVFDLITQVVGRAGRNRFKGNALIQTLSPENEIIALAAAQDFKSFYEKEIAIRRGMIYPPYCDICVIGFAGVGMTNVKNASLAFLNTLKEKISETGYSESVIILGPVPPRVSRINNNSRQRLIIKCVNSTAFRTLISDCLREFGKMRDYSKISAVADMNPENLY